MPLYPFRSRACDTTQDVARHMTDIYPPEGCSCGAPDFVRVIGAPSIKPVEHIDYGKERMVFEKSMKNPNLSPASKHDLAMEEHNGRAMERARKKREREQAVRQAEKDLQSAVRSGRIPSLAE